MEIKIVVEKRHAYVLSALFVLTLGIVLVNAYGGNSPTVLGHSSGELDITLAKLQSIVSSDFHNLGGTDIDTDTDTQDLGTSGSSITLTNGGSVVAPDLSCSDCISGTEISESGLSTVPSSTLSGVCGNSPGSFDICADTSGARCTLGSCADGSCDGCTGLGFYDLIIECSGGQIQRIREVSSAAC